MRNTAEDIIAITQAALDGKPVEVLIGDKAWTLIASLRFDWDKYVYRVRPKETKQIMDSYELRIFPGGGISIMLGGSQVICLGPENIDTLHAASLKARGIESPQYKEPYPQPRQASCEVNEYFFKDGFHKGHRTGWEAYQKALEEVR